MARKTDWICEGEVLDLDAGGLGGGGATYARDDGAHFDGLCGVGCGWFGLVVEVEVGVVFVLVGDVELKCCGGGDVCVCVMLKMGMVERETRRHRYIPQIPQLRNRSHWAPAHHAFFRCATFPRLLCFLRPSFRVAHHACDVTAITQQGQAIGSSPFRRHRGMLWLEVMRPMLENGFVDRSLEWEWVPLWVSLSRGRRSCCSRARMVRQRTPPLFFHGHALRRLHGWLSLVCPPIPHRDIAEEMTYAIEIHSISKLAGDECDILPRGDAVMINPFNPPGLSSTSRLGDRSRQTAPAPLTPASPSRAPTSHLPKNEVIPPSKGRVKEKHFREEKLVLLAWWGAPMTSFPRWREQAAWR